MNQRNFFAELKRRNVYKVAVAYAVVAWLLIQIATQVFPFFEIPNWAVRLVVLLLILGFPVALILAWAFELTPQGIKRAEDIPPDDPITSRTGRKLVGITIALAIVAAGLLALPFFRSKPHHPSKAPVPPAAAALPAIGDKSIAVLPFDNLSEDKANAYFAEGVQDEILTRLAKVADLKVISRTSAQRVKATGGDLRDMARQLGVSHILEGSVQKAGESVRVNVQLINPANDTHLWAEIYDRKLNDIFAVESDIAKTIVETLQAKLTGAEQHALVAEPTQNTVAHQLYLKGRYFWSKRTPADLQKALDYFNQAVREDPNFAVAYAAIASTYSLLPDYSAGTPRDCWPKAKTAAQRALELDETIAEAHAAIAAVLTSEGDIAGADREFRRAIQLNPNYATAHQWYADNVLMPLRKFDQATTEMKRALALDPLSLVINTDLGALYLMTRRYDEAIVQLRRTLEMDGNYSRARAALGRALELKGEPDAAIVEYLKAQQLSEHTELPALLGHAHAAAGRRDEALKYLKELERISAETPDRYVGAYSFALLYIGLGNKEAALAALERSAELQETDASIIPVDPFLDPLRGDPRFDALVKKVTGSPEDK